jgi:hypothetical protein
MANRENRVPQLIPIRRNQWLWRGSRAGGFNEAGGLATFLAEIRIFDELKKRCFGHHAQKLLEASALCENFLQAPRE